MVTLSDAVELREYRARFQGQSFFPSMTLKCVGAAIFRSQAARDLACLFDVDRNVASWRCLPASLSLDERFHFPDFLVIECDGRRSLIDAFDNNAQLPVCLLEDEALSNGILYRRFSKQEIYDGASLQNAKDLLRYAKVQPTLSDRIRLVAALSEEGCISLADCWRALPGRDAVAVAAALALQGHIDIDWQDEPIGPQTMLRRIGR